MGVYRLSAGILAAWGWAGTACQPQEGGPAAPAETPRPESPPTVQSEETPMAMTLTSNAFDAGTRIPTEYTGEGKDISPPLAWSHVPDGTGALALVCDDPDAPVGTWDHWLLWNLPADTRKLPAGVPKIATLSDLGGAAQGRNGWGKIGYGGPMPPPGHGNHHYHFVLYALDARLDLAPGANKQALMQAMEGHVLGQADLTGLYRR